MKEFVALNKLRKMLFRKVFLTAFDEYKEEVREKFKIAEKENQETQLEI